MSRTTLFLTLLPQGSGLEVGKRLREDKTQTADLRGPNIPCHMMLCSAIKLAGWGVVFPKQPLLGDWLGIGLLVGGSK